VVVGVLPVAADRRFLASATAPVAAEGRAARLARVLVLEVAPGAAVDDVPAVDRDGPILALGEAVEVAEAGFLAAAVVAAVELLFTLVGDAPAPELAVLLAVDMRRAVLVAEVVDARGFFSSSETDGCERCVEAVVGRFVVVVVPGRVGALLKPPVALVRVVEVVAGLAVVEPAVAVRRTVPAGATRFVAVVPGAAFASVAPLVGADAVGAGSGAAAGASVCCTTSNPSASDIMGDRLRAKG
jgi:hypothetical protein